MSGPNPTITFITSELYPWYCKTLHINPKKTAECQAGQSWINLVHYDQSWQSVRRHGEWDQGCKNCGCLSVWLAANPASQSKHLCDTEVANSQPLWDTYAANLWLMRFELNSMLSILWKITNYIFINFPFPDLFQYYSWYVFFKYISIFINISLTSVKLELFAIRV